MNNMTYPKAIQDCLAGKEDKSRIFPFLWVHGEPHSRLYEELEAIYQCGLRAFCIESRPHPDFCRDAWWEDVAFMLSYAKERNMQVWLLDDKHFPTGYANLAIEKKYPHLRRKCVRVACIDVVGPVNQGCCLLPQMDEDETLLSVCAFRRTGNGEDVDGNSGLLLENVRDGLVFWDLPEGVWRVFFVINTHRGPAHFKNYIDMCDAESCRVMVNEIYQPHYEHFKEYFGNTFRGFFSDEPCFANNIGSFTDTLGTPLLNIPWREDMPELLAQECGITRQEAVLLLPALWYTLTEHTAKLRLAYMNIITKLYRDNFSNMLGHWCAEHGVEYIGHVIEDLGAHMRLGYGSGHFFRALEGQHMAGMDIVLQQIVPGITDMCHSYCSPSGKRAHPDIYQLTIPKLAASAAHLDSKKQGRVMCELYGAFGWAEGVPEMKYLTDCMLSAGVNHLVPHAFSDKVEDPDCPPHFFNGGNNPQYPVFSGLMDYTARLCHILSSGTPCVPVAVYYNAESEWCGGECGALHDVAGVLGRCQTDFDFVPMDALLDAVADNECLKIGNCSYRVLILPYSQIVPQLLAQKLSALAQEGVLLLYLEAKPAQNEHGDSLRLPGAVISIEELPQYAYRYHWSAVKTPAAEPELRVLHRTEDEKDLYFFFNASLQKTVDVRLQLKKPVPAVSYDAWRNETAAVKMENGKHHLLLAPGEAVLWCASEKIQPMEPETETWKKVEVSCVQVTMQQDDVVYEKQFETLPNHNFAEDFPKFAGVIRYEFVIRQSCCAKKLQLERVGETARLWINGTDCGVSASAPHIFNVEKAWKSGENKVLIEVAVNQAYGRRDRFSVNSVLPPMGLFGEVFVK